MGKKWVCLLKSVGKVESNEVFCGAVEEEEGGKKLVEIRLSRSGAMTAISTARRSLIARRSMYSAPIAVTIAVTSLIGTICSKWPYRLISYPFKMKKYALYSS
ncbi:hypothetical protein L249_7885 [Ophiocordyceps polyrhachis-furcata BCC 54312]|uniref:Uncharacterized protein n=1 Tax=Ophiocordyceps polyrhachis-furcata BCC 54312 TaxID=1330021 RepID=A0A367L0R1_9HYPO|nr:hypothetical protein L249_7885 [Ophiocordyceps polyrhachis-furcata BCC 54312]